MDLVIKNVTKQYDDGLDEETGLAVMKLLKKYHEETGMTIVLVTHDEKVAKFATREIFLMDGRIVDSLI